MTDPDTAPPGIAAAAAEFGPFEGRVWCNTAHQGPLPRSAVEASRHAVALKAVPHRIADEDFRQVPEELRALLAELVGGSPEQIALGDSTSHGMHLIANGLRWQDGDEVLVLAGDYPATVLPWRRLAPYGVRTTALRPAGGLLTAAELEAAITPRTRVAAVTWVDSFTGRALDLDALGAVCRRSGVLLVVNTSQALGARPLDVSRTPVDAVVSCGYKWLCGPYGTGFSWLRPDLLERLTPQHAYWLAMRYGHGGLDRMRDTVLRDDLGVRAFDVFCPADFLNVLPWTASLRLLLAAGVDEVAAWDQALVGRFVAGLDRDRYRLVSPAGGAGRSTLVVLRDRADDRAAADNADGAEGTTRTGSAARTEATAATEARHRQLTAAGVDTAFREGALRVSLHLFHTAADVDRVLAALHAPAP
ncbi:aminotransferase class V-fold PLP-dependent enzyme [Streptomyces armeniacus]|uniref:Aminotransferase class V-fold PLP-dependent enzyme n=1 Tax=Streptomyces armeniacus TaxID=83291 RepID=A0A345XJ10_9ACTN|nr:aminotransferase class V-fold PLP-dependent enzyme [Streptomyces armeniacus]AXK31626.1 aminotransferase class V-fold PLP-dependent enzyme [Streptomyces armeniacus]